MTQFHVNSKGEAGACKATMGNCPFGGAFDHFSTPEGARVAYEAKNASLTLPQTTGKASMPYRSPEQIFNAMSKTLQIAKTEMLEKLDSVDHYSAERRMVADSSLMLRQGKCYLVTNIPRDTSDEIVGRTLREVADTLAKKNSFDNLIYTPQILEDNAALGLRSANLPPAQLNHDDFVRRVNGIASAATAHNSGDTIYETQANENKGHYIKFSSWPRANEAKRALAEQGFVASFGKNDHGQWLRVVQEDHAHSISSSELDWSATDGYSGKLSELSTTPRFMRGKTGEVVELEPLKEVRDAEGGITHWETKPLALEHKWKVTILNS